MLTIAKIINCFMDSFFLWVSTWIWQVGGVELAKNQILVWDLNDNEYSNWRYRIIESNQRVTMKTGTPPRCPSSRSWKTSI